VDIRQTLSQAHGLVKRVVDMGPLVSLILASVIRLKFQLINRDLMNQFQVLGLGEQLAVRYTPLNHTGNSLQDQCIHAGP
jgi:hypothetical protein